MTRILGAILSGGGASRFGSDKLMADIGGEPLIARVIDRLSPQVAEMVLLGRPYAGLPALVDRPASDMGPLAGLNAALHYAVENGHDAVLMVPGDAPDLPMDLAVQLGGASACPPPVYVSDSPVTGLWPAVLAPILHVYLAGDKKRAMAAFGDHVGAVAITLPQAIVNINTPQDYAAFLAR